MQKYRKRIICTIVINVATLGQLWIQKAYRLSFVFFNVIKIILAIDWDKIAGFCKAGSSQY